MPNAYLPRQQVHAWSDAIGEDQATHSAALSRLLREQGRLRKFVEENAASIAPTTAGVSIYLLGVVIRLFDLAGGRLRGVTWAQVREAEAQVQQTAASLLPLDDGFLERARSVPRSQPHILDEALMALFEVEPAEQEEDISQEEAFKVYLLLWVATEALDKSWKPPRGFQGETEYVHVPIEPEKRKAAASE